MKDIRKQDNLGIVCNVPYSHCLLLNLTYLGVICTLLNTFDRCTVRIEHWVAFLCFVHVLKVDELSNQGTSRSEGVMSIELTLKLFIYWQDQMHVSLCGWKKLKFSVVVVPNRVIFFPIISSSFSCVSLFTLVTCFGRVTVRWKGRKNGNSWIRF